METAIDNSIKRFQKRRSELEKRLGADPDVSMISCSEDDNGDREYRLRVTLEDGKRVSVRLLVGRWNPAGLFYKISRQVDRQQTTRDPKRVIREVKAHAEAWA